MLFINLFYIKDRSNQYKEAAEPWVAGPCLYKHGQSFAMHLCRSIQFIHFYKSTFFKGNSKTYM